MFAISATGRMGSRQVSESRVREAMASHPSLAGGIATFAWFDPNDLGRVWVYTPSDDSLAAWANSSALLDASRD